MHLPTKYETAAEFVARVEALIRRTSTALYVDTSFLMWLTKIGVASRNELTDWFRSNCRGRVHVPTWAAHEYFRHHVAATIPSELQQRARELSAVAGGTYAYLRPFMDSPLASDVGNIDVFRTEVRSTLTELKRVADAVGAWKDQYNKHAAEVMAFINDCAPCKADVFEYMSTIDAISDGRFGGRIPPGFQDRRKQERRRDEGEETGQHWLGSNSWGDLIFWKEILDHASAENSRGIVILSNDRKNDWYFNAARNESVDRDLKKSRQIVRPVPIPHPMLEYEARSAAGVTDVVLLDSPYLAELLRATAPEKVKSFVDVAIIPPQPEPTSQREKRAEAVRVRSEADDEKRRNAAAQMGVRFPDSDSVVIAEGALRRALFRSRNKPEGAVAELLQRCQATPEQGEGVNELLTAESLATWDQNMLLVFARELHDLSLSSQAGWKEAAVDLCALLPELPTKTAGCLYLGFLASMYLERLDNSPRLPPQSRVAKLLFDQQAAGFSGPALAAIRSLMALFPNQPLYLPSRERPPLAVKVEIESETEGQEQIGSLKINGVEVLNMSQGDETLTFMALFAGRSVVKGGELIERACDLFCAPFSQVIDADEFDRDFSFAPTTGFEKPGRVSIPKTGGR